MNSTDSGAIADQTLQAYLRKQLAGISSIVCVPLNVLLLFVPAGVYCGLAHMSCGLTFFCNFMAIVPLAGILGGATEALASHTGQLVGGLLNATFGNAVEMIVTVNAIRAGLVAIVQASLIGSILSNLLLVLGMAFIASGWNAQECGFNLTGAAANITCLVIAALSLTLPMVFTHVPESDPNDMVILSRLIAVVLTIVYVLFLYFQLRTHANLFMTENEEEEEPMMAASTAAGLLLAATACVAYCSEFLVDSIEDVSEAYGLPAGFIGLILLPIVGNAAEHTTAVTVAAKGKMDLALGVAVGSSTQIALFVVPFSVIVGWIVDVPMTLDFHLFETASFLLSVFIASSVLGDGKGNWLEGVMLFTSYVIVAIISWFIPPILD
jgi:Ca2+:H+ antiporter